MPERIKEKLMKRPVTGKDLMIVNMGPHHPSMHGVLRLIVTPDGSDASASVGLCCKESRIEAKDGRGREDD